MKLNTQANVGEFTTLFKQTEMWFPEQSNNTPIHSVSTGFEMLDAKLSYNGWPQGALTEILCDQQGVSELELLMPTISALSQQGRWIAWISPPSVPDAAVLQAHGVDLSKILVVYPRAETDLLKTLEQALRTGTCGAVLAWPNADGKSIRKLRSAAEAGKTMGFLFRSYDYITQPSPAELRITLDEAPTGLAVNIVKQRDAWKSGSLPVELKKVS